MCSKRWYFYRLLLFLGAVLLGKSLFAQNFGEAFLFRNSYYAQLNNPSFKRDFNKMVIAFPFAAGFSFANNSSFRLTDLIYTQPNGELSYDLNRFYQRLGQKNQAVLSASVPLLYMSIPRPAGQLSFYYKENFDAFSSFSNKTFLWFEKGNNAAGQRNFRSDGINLEALGYHELGAGFAWENASGITFGARGKLIFAQLKTSFTNWNYEVNTSEEGDLISVKTAGGGYLSLANEMIIRESNQLSAINVVQPVKNYFSRFRNPGLAFDLAIDYTINNESSLSAGLSDIGIVWFKTDAWDISQKGNYDFKGINITNSLDSKQGQDYVHPIDLMQNTKDSVRLAFQPFLDSTEFVSPLFPSVFVYYRQTLSNNLEIGVVNRTKMYRKFITNIFTVGIKKELGNFSFVASANVHQLNSLAVGGGVFWENGFMQAFILADNIYAAYYPADAKAYSLSAGVNFLFKAKNVSKKRNGKISKYFPYYRKY